MRISAECKCAHGLMCVTHGAYILRFKSFRECRQLELPSKGEEEMMESRSPHPQISFQTALRVSTLFHI